MREVKADLWQMADEVQADAVAITTNGYRRPDGRAVLGRGCALEASLRWPTLPILLGQLIEAGESGVVRLTNSSCYLADSTGTRLPYNLLAFPVKPSQVRVNTDRSNIVPHQRRNRMPGSIAPGFAAMADPELIVKSSHELMVMLDQQHWQSVLLVRPGVGWGGLDWNEVKPLLVPIFDDRVLIVSK